ncbi:hypothetical protein XA68_18556 [Ophiocordyceps unilateralis]|uniref:Asl1-like glycosyl hydrolase catalytic domain-containing protein n=1 Tax=Ophiocordyceps unilateralis TaxID=268505 RepID=A0A2A9PJE0_OPHUN|nr:hypothetical protein XA68_18556 [Ophiocordyceps unilateralis]
MSAKKIVILAAVAALAEQASAFNSHRHLHRREPKYGAVHWVTVWTTATTTIYDAEKTAVSGPEHVANYAPVQAEAVKPTSNAVYLKSEAPAQPPAPAAQSPAPAAQSPAPYAPPPPPEVESEAPAVPSPRSPSAAPEAPKTTLEIQPKPINSLLQPIAPYVPPLAPSVAPSNPSGGGNGNSASGSPGFSGKRGLAYNDASLANNFDDQCNGCSGWGYNWGSTPQGLSSKISYVPMLWGNKPEFTKNWHSDAQKAVDNGAKAMFSFNEPDNAGQANMSPQQAAELHVQYMNPWGGKALIGSPAITNSGQAGQGIEWLGSFVKACDNMQEKCRIDFCVVHWYSQPEYADTLYDHIAKAHKVCGQKPIWLTEFGPVDAGGQPMDAPAFLKTVVRKLDEIEYLHAYAPFMCSAGKLMSSANQLSAMGKAYADVS